jgi:hypothetical protein
VVTFHFTQSLNQLGQAGQLKIATAIRKTNNAPIMPAVENKS